MTINYNFIDQNVSQLNTIDDLKIHIYISFILSSISLLLIGIDSKLSMIIVPTSLIAIVLSIIGLLNTKNKKSGR